MSDLMSNIPVAPGLGGGRFDLTPYLLSASEHYDEPHWLLEYNGVPFSPLGGIQAITGHKKNGKTFLVVQLIAAILGGDGERMSAKLPGLRCVADTMDYLGKEATVLYIDTEMERLNSAKVLRRVHWLCGWDLEQDNERFKVLWLREMKSNKERKALVMDAIEQMKPTAVFIDGIRDIIMDFNDNAESSELISELMSKASELNCCIWNCLHYNPKVGGDADGKMRGHLGTELGNKVSDTFSSTKKKGMDGVVKFTVSQVDARGKDVPDWTFDVVDDAGGLGIPRMCGGVVEALPVQRSKDEKRLMETREALETILSGGIAKKWDEIKDGICSYFEIGYKAANRRISEAKNAGIIKHINDDNKWYLSATADSDETEINTTTEDDAPF